MKQSGIRVRSLFDRAAVRHEAKCRLRTEKRPGRLADDVVGPISRRATSATEVVDACSRPSRTASPHARVLPRRALQPLDELVELQLLEALPDRVQLARRILDQLAPLSAQVERFAQPGLAGVEPLDDLLEPFDR